MENYEQKYKKALGWMKSIYHAMQGADKEDAEHYFPELRESEDERDERLHNGIIESLICYRAKLYDEGDKEVSAIVDEEISWMRDCWKKQKPAEWSEEDEKMLDSIDETLFIAETGCSNEVKLQIEYKRDWIKSLKPQPHWRPSREQLGALNYAYCEIFASGKDTPCLHILQNLIDELKTLCDYE